MQRNILILVVYLSFLGVVLAHKSNYIVQVIMKNGQEEHLRSVYRFIISPISFHIQEFIFLSSIKLDLSMHCFFLKKRNEINFVTELLILKPINTRFIYAT
jgi:hypothetical protein